MARGNCPECDAEIEVDDPVIREVVEIEGERVKFSVVEMKGEDWGE